MATAESIETPTRADVEMVNLSEELKTEDKPWAVSERVK